MPSLFISYRRTDSPDTVKLIHERLKRRLPGWDIFYDHKSIPPGEQFPELLRAKVASASVVLVVIGPRWLGILHERKSAAIDHVRAEVRLALETAPTVVPILVGHAKMPTDADLADFADLQPLLQRNGHSVRPDPDFDRDLEPIISHLKKASLMSRFRTVLVTAGATLAVAATALLIAMYFRLAPAPAPADGGVRTAALTPDHSILPRLPLESTSPQPLAPGIPGDNTDVPTDLIEKITVKIDVGPGDDLKEPVALDLGLGYPLWLYPVGRKSGDMPPRGAIPQQSTAKEKIAAGDSATFTFTTKGDAGQDRFRTSEQLLANTRLADIARVGFACKGAGNWMLAGYEITINDKPFASGNPKVNAGDRAAAAKRLAELALEITPLDQVRTDLLQLLQANQFQEKDKMQLVEALRKLRPLVREKAWLEGQLAGRYLWFADPDHKAPAAGRPAARMAKVTLVTNSHTGADTRNNVYVRIGGRKYFISSAKQPLTYKRGPQVFNLDLLAGPLTDADLRDWAVGMLANAAPYDVAPDRWHGSRLAVEIDGDVVYDSEKRPADRRSLNAVRLIPPAHLDGEGNLVTDREDKLQIHLWEPAKGSGLDPATGIAMAPPPAGDPLAPKPEPSQPTPAADSRFDPSANGPAPPRPQEKPTPAADSPFDPSEDTAKPPEAPTPPVVPPIDPSADTPPPLKPETPPPLNPPEPAPPGVPPGDAPPPLLPGEQPVQPAPENGGNPPALQDHGGGAPPPLPEDGGAPPPLPDGGPSPDALDNGGGVIPPLPDDGGAANLGNVPPIVLLVNNDNKPDNSKLEQLLADILAKLNANPPPPPPPPKPSGIAPQVTQVRFTPGSKGGWKGDDTFTVEWQATGDESEVDHYRIVVHAGDPSKPFPFTRTLLLGKAKPGDRTLSAAPKDENDPTLTLETFPDSRYLVAAVTAMPTPQATWTGNPELSAARMVFPKTTDPDPLMQPQIGDEKFPHLSPTGPDGLFKYHWTNSSLSPAGDQDFEIDFPTGASKTGKVWQPFGFLLNGRRVEGPVRGGLHLGVRTVNAGDVFRVHLTCLKPKVKSNLIADLGFQEGQTPATGSVTATIQTLRWFRKAIVSPASPAADLGDVGDPKDLTRFDAASKFLPITRKADAVDLAGNPAPTPDPFKVAVNPTDPNDPFAAKADYLVITLEFRTTGTNFDAPPVLFGVRMIPQ